MRFTRDKELRDAYLNKQEKVIVKFLWLPLTISGETRWLEKAEIKYEVYWEYSFPTWKRVYYWKAIEFLNK